MFIFNQVVIQEIGLVLGSQSVELMTYLVVYFFQQQSRHMLLKNTRLCRTIHKKLALQVAANLVRKDMEINVHKRLSNTTPTYK